MSAQERTVSMDETLGMSVISRSILEGVNKGETLVVITTIKNEDGFVQEDITKDVVGIPEKSDSDYSKLGSQDYNNQDHNKEYNYADIILSVKDGIPKYLVNEDSKKKVFIEPFYPKERMIILGGGHIALPLVEFGAKLGFSVVVCDDRPSFANINRFPEADMVLCESFDKVFEKITITPNDYIIVITRGHRHDTECLRQILARRESIYVGMIGSRRRTRVVKEQLIAEGYFEDRINKICTPIGLSIGAVTPEEISISILAEIIQRKRLDKSDKHRINRSDLDFSIIETMANRNKSSYSVVTVLSTKGSTPRGAGAKMIVYRDGQIEGSIGGGCSEAAIIRDAIEIIGTKKYMLKKIDMTGDVAEEEGMVCGGIMEVFIEDGVF
jgi:xanthine dehydrogenase accessory factor